MAESDEARIHFPFTDTLQTALDSLKGIFSLSIKTPVPLIAPNTPKKLPTHFGQYTLFSHQKALIENMKQKENSFRTGSNNLDNINLFSRYAILGDPAGTGKTIAALAYISYCKKFKTPCVANFLHHQSQTNFFSISSSSTNINTNLFIVPLNDLANLTKILENQTELKYAIIKKENHIYNIFNNSAALHGLDLIVVSSTQYNKFSEMSSEHGIQFKRCFFENINNLNLYSAHCTINAEFTWLITHDWFNILYPNINLFDYGSLLDNIINDRYNTATEDFKNFIEAQREIFTNNTPATRSLFYRFVNVHPFRHRLILTTTGNYLRISIDPIEIKNHTIKYNYDTEFQKIYSISSPTVQNLLNNNEIVSAMEAIGVNRIKQNELVNYTRSEDLDDQCPICCDDYQYPTVTACCKNVFCGHCIIKSIKSTPTVICPLCRQHVVTNRLISVLPEKDPPPGLHKLDALVKYLKQILKKEHVLLYYPSVIHFSKLKDRLKKENIHYELLNGPRASNKRKIDMFNDGKVKFLIIQEDSYLISHYVPKVTNLILYPDNNPHKTINFFYNRIHRLIREEPLTVVNFGLEVDVIAPASGETTGTDAAGTAEAAVGDINTNLGDSVVATSHT